MHHKQQTERAILWTVLVAAMMLPAALAWRSSSGGAPASPGDLEDYGPIPDFALVERSGEPLRRADLAGSPWFASFIFTRCTGTCPVLSSRMAELQQRLGSDARLVSFSVDPRHDTPDVLSAYADQLGARRTQWLFVTGPVPDVRALVRDGFHLSVAESETDGAITHSDRVALVDGQLRIRRYYLGTDPTWIAEALRDLDSLRKP